MGNDAPSPLLSFCFVRNPSLGRSAVAAPPRDLHDLAGLLQRPHLADPSLPWGQAIELLERHVRSTKPEFSFFRDLLPNICQWAGDPTWSDRPLPLLRCGEAGQVRLPRPWVRSLLANASLLNLRSADQPPSPVAVDLSLQDSTFGRHSWERLYGEGERVISTQKVACLLAYLNVAKLEEEKEEEEKQRRRMAAGKVEDEDRDEDDDCVVIERLRIPASRCFPPPSTAAATSTFESWWATSTAPLNAIRSVAVTTAPMEASPAGAFVDFANRYVGYRSIIPSATQEEILWCAAPEAWPASYLCEAMGEDEVVVIRGVRRISAYSGYGRGFRWQGLFKGGPEGGSSRASSPSGRDEGPDGKISLPYPPGTLSWKSRQQMDILAMDAMVVGPGGQEQFGTAALWRDLCKAYLCFQAVRPTERGISTGNWGCGAFGGNRYLKFLQQLCAVAEANADRAARGEAALRLDFSTFGDAEFASKLESLISALSTGHSGPAVPAGSAAKEEKGGVNGRSGPVLTMGELCSLLAEYGRRAPQRAARGESGDEVFYRWIMGMLTVGKFPGRSGRESRSINVALFFVGLAILMYWLHRWLTSASG